MKILAVDDSRVMLRIISATIEMIGFEPLTASNGREALEVLEKEYEDVSLVLLDWNMPEMDGYETLLAIKGDERFRSIPVMMVTTESEQRKVIQALKAGANAYLSKPFNQQDLAVKIMETLGLGF